jgi:hypothetical protein
MAHAALKATLAAKVLKVCQHRSNLCLYQHRLSWTCCNLWDRLGLPTAWIAQPVLFGTSPACAHGLSCRAA